MKKLCASVLILALLVSISSAQVFIGSRQAGMGGTGVASAKGLNAVAYNPAGLLKGPTGELLFSIGAATQGMDKLLTSMNNASDPSSFLADNVDSALDVNGSLSGIAGVSINKIGVSLIVPGIMANLSKQAGTIAGSANVGARYDLALTGGRTFTLPAFPIGSLDVGASLKSINYSYGMLNVDGINPNATQYWGSGSGIGIDLGARTNLEIPALTSFSVGIALRDLLGSVNISDPKMRQDTYNYITDTVMEGTEQPDTTRVPSGNYNLPIALAIGCAGTVPGIGLDLAADLENISGGTGPLAVDSESILHLGFEYPLMLRSILLRGGIASSQNISLTTLGAKLNIPFVTLELAAIFDGKNSKNNSFVVDAGFGF